MGALPTLVVPGSLARKCRYVQGSRRRPLSPRVIRLSSRLRQTALQVSSLLDGQDVPASELARRMVRAASATGLLSGYQQGQVSRDPGKSLTDFQAEAAKLEQILKDRSIGKIVASRSTAAVQEFVQLRPGLSRVQLSKLQRQLHSCRTALELEREENIKLLRETSTLRQSAKYDEVVNTVAPGTEHGKLGAMDSELMKLESILQTAVDWEYARKDAALAGVQEKLAALEKTLDGSGSVTPQEHLMREEPSESPAKSFDVLEAMHNLASQAAHVVQKAQQDAGVVAKMLHVDIKKLQAKVDNSRQFSGTRPPSREMRSVTEALKQELSALKGQLRLEKAENAALRKELEHIRVEPVTAGESTKPSDALNPAYQKAANELKKRVGSLEKTITATTKSLQEARADKTSQLSLFSSQIALLQKERAAAEGEAAALCAQLEAATRQLAAEQEKTQSMSATASELALKLSALETSSVAAVQEASRSREETSRAELRLEELNAAVRRLELEKAQLQRYERRAQQLQERLEQEQTKNALLSESNEQLKSKISALEKAAQAATKSLQEAREDRQRQLFYLADQIALLTVEEGKNKQLSMNLAELEGHNQHLAEDLEISKQLHVEETAKAASLAKVAQELTAKVIELEQTNLVAARALEAARCDKQEELEELSAQLRKLRALELDHTTLSGSLAEAKEMYLMERARASQLAEVASQLTLEVGTLKDSNAAAARQLQLVRQDKQQQLSDLARQVEKLQRFESEAVALAGSLEQARAQLQAEREATTALSSDKSELSSRVVALERAYTSATRSLAEARLDKQQRLASLVKDQAANSSSSEAELKRYQAMTVTLAQQVEAGKAYAAALGQQNQALAEDMQHLRSAQADAYSRQEGSEVTRLCASNAELARRLVGMERAAAAAAKSLAEARKDKQEQLVYMSREVMRLKKYEKEAEELSHKLDGTTRELEAQALRSTQAGELEQLNGHVHALEGANEAVQQQLEAEKSRKQLQINALAGQVSSLKRYELEAAMIFADLQAASGQAQAEEEQAVPGSDTNAVSTISQVDQMAYFEHAAARLMANLNAATEQLGRGGDAAANKQAGAHLSGQIVALLEANGVAFKALKEASLSKHTQMCALTQQLRSVLKYEEKAQELYLKLADVASPFAGSWARFDSLECSAKQLAEQVLLGSALVVQLPELDSHHLDKLQRFEGEAEALAKKLQDASAHLVAPGVAQRGHGSAAELRRVARMYKLAYDTAQRAMAQSGLEGSHADGTARRLSALETTYEEQLERMTLLYQGERAKASVLSKVAQSVERLQAEKAAALAAVAEAREDKRRQLTAASADMVQLKAAAEKAVSLSHMLEQSRRLYQEEQSRSRDLGVQAAAFGRKAQSLAAAEAAATRALAEARKDKQHALLHLAKQVAVLHRQAEASREAPPQVRIQDHSYFAKGAVYMNEEGVEGGAQRLAAAARQVSAQVGRIAGKAAAAARVVTEVHKRNGLQKLTGHAASVLKDRDALERFARKAAMIAERLDGSSRSSGVLSSVVHELRRAVKDLSEDEGSETRDSGASQGEMSVDMATDAASSDEHSFDNVDCHVESPTSTLAYGAEGKHARAAWDAAAPAAAEPVAVFAGKEPAAVVAVSHAEKPPAKHGPVVLAVREEEEHKKEGAATVLASKREEADEQAEGEVAMHRDGEVNSMQRDWRAQKREKANMQDEMIMLSADLTQAKGQVLALRSAEERAVMRYVNADRRYSESMAESTRCLIQKLKESECAALLTTQKLTSRLVLTQRQMLKLEEMVEVERGAKSIQV